MSRSMVQPRKGSMNILNTPVMITPGFFSNLLTLWAGMSWLSGKKHPERGLLGRTIAGAFSVFALVFADVGHAFAHSFSARFAGAPIDQIQLSSGMPRTIYFNNRVSPSTHILRALGGPLFSALGLGTSLLLRAITPHKSMAREVAGWSCTGHALILTGSLAPLPIVDGGSLLKWSLVENGRTTAEADQIVTQVGVLTGAAACSAGAVFAARRRWLSAAGLLAAGIVAIGAALGKIR